MIPSVFLPCVLWNSFIPSNHCVSHRQHATTPKISGLWYEDGRCGGVHFTNSVDQKSQQLFPYVPRHANFSQDARGVIGHLTGQGKM